jgi:NAD-dependent deacetylase
VSGLSADQQALADLIVKAKRPVVLTGAGVSTASGIPDFRSPGTGQWANVDPQQVASLDGFCRNPARFWAFYRERLDCFDHVQPNRAHGALAALQQHGLLGTIITQNIDGLHQRAGSSDVLEVHGTTVTMTCTGCQRSYERAQRDRLADPDGAVRCEDCGAVVKPDTILFGENLPDCFMTASIAAARADLLICAGTSLQVWPVAGLCEATLRAGGTLAIVTKSWTPFDQHATVKLTGELDDELDIVARHAIQHAGVIYD